MDLSLLEKRIGVVFKNKNLLLSAITFRSAHNSRLEQVGASVLGLIVTEYLFKHFPTKFEGELSPIRDSLVMNKTLAVTSHNLKLNEFFPRTSVFTLPRIFRALLGAIYLDQGYETVVRFVVESLITKIGINEKIVGNPVRPDIKSQLQQKVYASRGVFPEYRFIRTIGPASNKIYEYAIYYGNEFAANGTGRSRREATRKAAENALKKF